MAKEYIAVKDMNKKYPAFTKGAVRALILNADKHNFRQCIIKLNKRVLIDATEFEKWVDSHRLLKEAS